LGVDDESDEVPGRERDHRTDNDLQSQNAVCRNCFNVFGDLRAAIAPFGT
jgi:hypothetical protein